MSNATSMINNMRKLQSLILHGVQHGRRVGTVLFQ